jgi:hypothetical protein
MIKGEIMKCEHGEYTTGVVNASEIMVLSFQKDEGDILGGITRASNHIYGQCKYCYKLVRLTGLFARLHFCCDRNPRVVAYREVMGM